MKFAALLIKRQAPIRRAIYVLEWMTQDVEKGGCIERQDLNALLVFLRYFVEAYHQALEENILFPLLRSARVRPVLRERLKHIVTGHNEARALIEKAQLALFSETPSEFIASAEKLTRSLAEQLSKEEQILFPIAEKILTRKDADELERRIEQIDAEFGCSRCTLLVELLQELETRYLRRVA